MKTAIQQELDSVELQIVENQDLLRRAREGMSVIEPLYIKMRLGDVDATAEYHARAAEAQRLKLIDDALQAKRSEILPRFALERKQLEAMARLRAREQQTVIGGVVTAHGLALPLSGSTEDRLAQVRAQMAEHQAAIQAIRDEQQSLRERAINGDKKAIKRHDDLVDQERDLAPRSVALQTALSRLTNELNEARKLQRMNDLASAQRW